jgi:hypothetical protein
MVSLITYCPAVCQGVAGIRATNPGSRCVSFLLRSGRDRFSWECVSQQPPRLASEDERHEPLFSRRKATGFGAISAKRGLNSPDFENRMVPLGLWRTGHPVRKQQRDVQRNEAEDLPRPPQENPYGHDGVSVSMAVPSLSAWNFSFPAKLWEKRLDILSYAIGLTASSSAARGRVRRGAIRFCATVPTLRDSSRGPGSCW